MSDWRNITLPEMRQEKTWFSPAVQREMSVCRWGYFGKPLLLLPTAGGDFLESERFLMLKVLAPLIEAGRLKVFSCGSVSGDGWLDADASPKYRALLQARFDQYVQDELLPYIVHECGPEVMGKIAVTGASLGAYNALNTATKHPEWFDLAVCMSGTYDFKRWMDGYFDENYYFNMPLHFLPGLGDGPLLDNLRRIHFVLASGQGRAEAPWESEWIANILRSKGVPVSLEIWGKDVPHDWPTWRTMLPMFLDRLL
jgi:esterase/lipase superfamily enzyme